MLGPESLNHVAIPPRWREYLYHVGSFFTVNSILQAGFIAGGKDPQEGRQTVFFTPLGLVGDETEEEHDDITKPRHLHKRTIGKFLRMQSLGSIRETQKIKNYNSGNPDLTPSSFMTQCQLTALKSGKHQRRQNFAPDDSNATTSSESCIEESLEKCITTIKQRAIVC